MSPEFSTGDRVRVQCRYPPGHLRTPYYIRGQTGVVERVLDAFPDPEGRAYGKSGEPKPRLYRVRFLQKDIWRDYAGPNADTIDVEIYQHWLEPVEVPRSPAGRG